MVLDQGTLTQLMILIKLGDGIDKPAAIAKGIGITIQGVNYHLKILRKRGFIDDENQISKIGFSFLENGLSSLRDFVSENMAKIDNIVTWEAISDEDLGKGETVGIYMKNGYLHASRSITDPKGVTKIPARAGEIVAVTSISGIVNVQMGSVSISVLPVIEEAGEIGVIIDYVKSQISGSDLVAVIGEEAFYAVTKAGSKPDLEFASLNGVFEAAIRGLNSALFVSSRRFHYVLGDLKDLQNRYKEINVRIKYL